MKELVGEIHDEIDTGAREHEDTVLRKRGAVMVDGGLTIPEDPCETVGGFVMERLGRVARPGDVVEVDEYRLEVLATDRRRVGRVRITRLPPAETAATNPID